MQEYNAETSLHQLRLATRLGCTVRPPSGPPAMITEAVQVQLREADNSRRAHARTGSVGRDIERVSTPQNFQLAQHS